MGTLLIKVHDSGVVAHYSSVYDIKLSSFKSSSVTKNGIYEPGDTIEISDIEIRNDGGMPTPRGAKIRVSIVTNDAMATNTQELYLIDAIHPGCTLRLPGTMQFTLKEYTGDGKVPLVDKKVLDLRADTVRVRHRFHRFTKPEEITLTHPIEIERVRYGRSLLPREFTQMTFEVKNSSLKEIGPAAAERALRRAIELTCSTLVTPDSSSSVVFCDHTGKELSTPKLTFSISKINPKRNVAVSCHVKIKEAKEDHTAHYVESQLYLQKIAALDKKVVHAPTLQLKEGISYRPKDSDDFLLVTNLSTSAEELTAWKSLARELGLSFSIWDPSVYQHMRLSDTSPGGAAQSLLSSWRDKVIVVLNQGNSLGDILSNPTGIISQTDLDDALRQHNIRLYTIGESIVADGRPSLLREVAIRGKSYFNSISSFIASLDTHPPDSETPAVVEVSRVFTKQFGAAAQNYFESQVDAIRRQLKRRYPRETFLIIPEFDPHTLTKRFFGGILTESLGRIEIQLEEAPSNSSIIGISAADEKTHKARFVQSKANKVGLLSSLHSRQLLELTLETLTGAGKSPSTVEFILNAVALRIAAEAGLHLSKSDKHTDDDLPLLSALKHGILNRVSDASPPIIIACASLLCRLAYLRDQEVPWLQRVLPLGATHDLVRRFNGHLGEIDRHVRKHLTEPGLALYLKTRHATTSSLKSQFRGGDRGRLLEGLVSHNPTAGITVSDHNPYNVQGEVSDAEFEKRAADLSSQVEDSMVERKKLVKDV
jgi:hypothetical protein